jgi:hypothetical protein
MGTPPIKAPQALTLTNEPQANVERYDALRKAREAVGAHAPPSRNARAHHVDQVARVELVCHDFLPV